MLSSIRSKTIFLAVAILLFLSILLAFSALVNFKNNKKLIIDSCDYTITTYTERINKEIARLEDNAKDLALLGEVYYKTGKSDDISKYFINSIFKNYSNSLGGGIWFEPYSVNKNKKLKCIYAFHDKHNKLSVIDNDDAIERYNYLKRSWYNEIKSKLLSESSLAWSKPYMDGQGSMALMTTVGFGIYDNNKLIGMSTVDWDIDSIIKTVSKMKLTKNSFVLFADKTNDCIILSTDKHSNSNSTFGKSLKEIPWYVESQKETNYFNYLGTTYFSYNKTLDNGMVLIFNIPKNELFNTIIEHLIIMLIILMSANLLITGAIYYVLKKNVNLPIEELIKIADKIGKGDLNTEIKLSKPKELAELANAYNKMTKDMKSYLANLNEITKEKEKMDSELSIAKTIQYSALPGSFYNNVDEFSIHAYMKTAKKVGGDFYDFFFINPIQFVFLIADVSGKGIPAALFMMTTKTLIKNLAKENYLPKDLIQRANKQICENNKQDMFVTMLIGVVDIFSGNITYINCGHNSPLIKRQNGDFEYLKLDSNIVLGAYPDFDFKIQEDKLKQGDTLFLYTDGVTEALNENDNFYGDNRLKSCLNEYDNKNSQDLKSIICNVENNINDFIGKREQSDDITMLAFRYNGQTNIVQEDKIIVPACIENYGELSSWLEENCTKFKVPQKDVNKIMLITEEIFVNIASYAYQNVVGNIGITFKKDKSDIVLCFHDSGIQYNPLEKDDPDINLNAEDRQIGGLGIYLVKKNASYVSYEYKNGHNILMIRISINPE